MELDRIIQAAIETEQVGAGLYDKAAGRAEDHGTTALFSWLARQERLHTEMLRRHFKVGPGSRESEENIPLIQKIRDAIEGMEKTFSIMHIIELGIQLEKDTEKLYRDLAGYLEIEEEFAQFLGEGSTERGKRTVSVDILKLAQWEAGHVRGLEALKKKLESSG